MINRDSMVLWIGAGAAAVGFLAADGRWPGEWAYQDWLKFLAAIFAWLMGKLSTSPLKGENDDNRIGR